MRDHDGRASAVPFYFDPAVELFGCHHAPDEGPARECGVVVCPPMGPEYVQSHRGLRQLAVRLADAGFHALRFDFYGCGDSRGDGSEWDVGRWRDDVSAAIAEVRARSRLEKVCVVGLRLGAALATVVAAETGDVDGLVLWEPVVDGSAYVEELEARHRDWLRGFPARVKSSSRGTSDTLVLGFPLTQELRAGLAQVDLLAIGSRPARNVLVVEGTEGARTHALTGRLRSFDCAVEYERVSSQQMWTADLERVVVPHESLQRMVSWLSKVYA